MHSISIGIMIATISVYRRFRGRCSCTCSCCYPGQVVLMSMWTTVAVKCSSCFGPLLRFGRSCAAAAAAAVHGSVAAPKRWSITMDGGAAAEPQDGAGVLPALATTANTTSERNYQRTNTDLLPSTKTLSSERVRSSGRQWRWRQRIWKKHIVCRLR